jgi:hypothetical protein
VAAVDRTPGRAEDRIVEKARLGPGAVAASATAPVLSGKIKIISNFLGLTFTPTAKKSSTTKSTAQFLKFIENAHFFRKHRQCISWKYLQYKKKVGVHLSKFF